MFDHFNLSLDYLLNPVHLILAVSLVLSIIAYQLKTRRKLLIVKLCGDLTFGIYLITLGGFAGGFAALVAVTGGLIQILTPDEKLKETAKMRICLAVILSIIIIIFSAQRQSDLLPVLAVVYSRFAELSGSRQIIALCMLLAGIAWLCYNFTNGFTYAVLYNILTIPSMAFGILRHRKGK